MLSAGDVGTASFIVKPSDTAKALAISAADEFPDVFATSRMVALMELAAARAMRGELADGQLSVGVALNVGHTAASAIGAEVRAVASFKGMEGKLYAFHVEAFDEYGPIGAGEHTRAIVDTQRLVSGAERRRVSK